MPSVTATKTLNSSSARVWWSPVTPHRLALRVISWVVPAQIERGPVPAQPRMPGVRPGQQEGGEELPSPATIATLTAPATGPGHQPGRGGRRDDIGEVPEEEGGDGGDDEPAVAAAHLLEGGAALHLQVDVGRAAARSARSGRGLAAARGRGARPCRPARPSRRPARRTTGRRAAPPRHPRPVLLLHRSTLLVRDRFGRVPKDGQSGKIPDSSPAGLHPIR